jgi:hypothetical protein
MQALAHTEKFPAGLLRPYLTAAVAFLDSMRVELSDHLTYKTG